MLLVSADAAGKGKRQPERGLVGPLRGRRLDRCNLDGVLGGGSRRSARDGKIAGRLDPFEQHRADVFAVTAPIVGAATDSADAARLDVNFHVVEARAAHLGGEGVAGADGVMHAVDVSARPAQAFGFQGAFEIGLGEGF